MAQEFGNSLISAKALFDNKVLYREEQTSKLKLDFQELSSYDPDLYERAIQNPQEFISSLNREINELFSGVIGEKKESESDTLPKKLKNFEIVNMNNGIVASKIRNKDIGKLCNVRGIIKKITKVFPRIKTISYECSSCGDVVKVRQEGKEKKRPTRCSCGKKNRFLQVSKEIENIQEINLEEMPEDIEGRQPQQIRVYLEDPLTDPDFSERLQAGKRVEIMGIVNELPRFMTKRDKEENVTDFMLHAINIHSLEDEEDDVITDDDVEYIEEIARDNPLEKLSNNLASSIYGHDLVKKSIVLQLAKGVRKTKGDGSKTRGDIHILLASDPGCGKTHLLNCTHSRTPRSSYISGQRASSVGLSAMVIKDELSGDFALEAGALVLADGSTLFLDELDKMQREQQDSLYEPLESQTVTINKAGIRASLNARTSILAAANPRMGKFDLSHPLSEQLNLSLPLLNRFDLIFIIKDEQKKEEDENAVDYLFDSYSDDKKRKENEVEDEITPQFFRKYIAYVRKLQPKIREKGLKDKLKKIYLNIRQQSKSVEGGESGLPINLRNAEGLLRLATANAKLRLSDYVEKQDLDIAEGIFMHSLSQFGYTESGLLDTSRVTQKVPVSKRGKLEKVMALLNELTQNEAKEIPLGRIKEKAQEFEIADWELNNMLDELRRNGQIFSPKLGYYGML